MICRPCQAEIFSICYNLLNKQCFEMPYTENYLKEKLEKELNATYVAVTDQSDGCGAKFSAVIVSPKFEGKALLQRHRMVNSILEEELKVIHAFSQQTLTPQQWQEKKS